MHVATGAPVSPRSSSGSAASVVDRHHRRTETVFERFYRAPEARSQPGSGLGLSIVDYVAPTHDGSAAVVDTAGLGATVELRLPLAPKDKSHPADTG